MIPFGRFSLRYFCHVLPELGKKDVAFLCFNVCYFVCFVLIWLFEVSFAMTFVCMFVKKRFSLHKTQ